MCRWSLAVEVDAVVTWSFDIVVRSCDGLATDGEAVTGLDVCLADVKNLLNKPGRELELCSGGCRLSKGVTEDGNGGAGVPCTALVPSVEDLPRAFLADFVLFRLPIVAGCKLGDTGASRASGPAYTTGVGAES